MGNYTLPKGHKIIGCKWVFTLKYKENEILNRHKKRLVVKGFSPTYGVDYPEIFSLVAKLNTIQSPAICCCEQRLSSLSAGC